MSCFTSIGWLWPASGLAIAHRGLTYSNPLQTPRTAAIVNSLEVSNCNRCNLVNCYNPTFTMSTMAAVFSIDAPLMRIWPWMSTSRRMQRTPIFFPLSLCRTDTSVSRHSMTTRSRKAKACSASIHDDVILCFARRCYKLPTSPVLPASSAVHSILIGGVSSSFADASLHVITGQNSLDQTCICIPDATIQGSNASWHYVLAPSCSCLAL